MAGSAQGVDGVPAPCFLLYDSERYPLY